MTKLYMFLAALLFVASGDLAAAPRENFVGEHWGVIPHDAPALRGASCYFHFADAQTWRPEASPLRGTIDLRFTAILARAHRDSVVFGVQQEIAALRTGERILRIQREREELGGTNVDLTVELSAEGKPIAIRGRIDGWSGLAADVTCRKI